MLVEAERPPKRLPKCKGGFGVVYADPPWPIQTWKRAWNKPYSIMNLESLNQMPVGDITAEDSILAVWSFSQSLPHAIDLIERWGFEYKGVLFVWVKTTVTGKLVFGMGPYTRPCSEFCLFGIRGSPKTNNHSLRQVFMSQRREHSKKPDEVREMLVSMFDGPYLELFARDKTKGWRAWGNEL